MRKCYWFINIFITLANEPQTPDLSRQRKIPAFIKQTSWNLVNMLSIQVHQCMYNATNKKFLLHKTQNNRLHHTVYPVKSRPGF